MVTNFLENSVFTWKNLVSVAQSSKECTTNINKLTNFQFFKKFLYKPNLYLLSPTLLFELAKINCDATKGWLIS